jgi:hypothetical protein
VGLINESDKPNILQDWSDPSSSDKSQQANAQNQSRAKHCALRKQAYRGQEVSSRASDEALHVSRMFHTRPLGFVAEAVVFEG